MNCGLLARADHRGIATITRAVYDHLHPARTLVVVDESNGYDVHRDWYPDRFGVVTIAQLDAHHYDWRPFLDGLDAVYVVETPHDFRLFTFAYAAGARTILHVMPELDPYARQRHLPRPDVVAVPTTWRADDVKPDVVLPIPVDPWTAEPGDAVLHPAGHPAMRDRNGTRIVLGASTHTRRRIVVRAQHKPDQPWHRAEIEVDDFEDRAALFAGAALVVLPRRYGGLSLPLQEALSAGLPVLATGVDPYAADLDACQQLPATHRESFEAKGGRIPCWDVDAEVLAQRIDEAFEEPGRLDAMRAVATQWTAERTWDVLRPQWEAVLAG